MSGTKLRVIYFAVLGLLVMGERNATAYDILMTGGTFSEDCCDAFPADQLILERLESQGHVVTYFSGDEIDGAGAAELDIDLVIMSSTSGSGTLRGREWEFLETPLLTWESALVRVADGEMYISTGEQSGNLGAAIVVWNASHPLFDGIDVADGDELEMFDSDQNFFGLTGDIAPGAEILAVGTEPCCDEDRTMIVAVEAGEEALEPDLNPYENGLFPGRRVYIPLSDSSFEFLTEEGLQLWDNAIEYAVNGPFRFDSFDLNRNGVLDGGDFDLQAADALDYNGDGTVNFFDRADMAKDGGTFLGDSNFDNEFNSSDFVTVIGAGFYDSGNAANYEVGDWNGDGLFNSSDLVAVFTTGGYEAGVRAAAAAVPEPSSVVLLLLGALALVRRRR